MTGRIQKMTIRFFEPSGGGGRAGKGGGFLPSGGGIKQC